MVQCSSPSRMESPSFDMSPRTCWFAHFLVLILHLGFDNIMATAYATVQSIARMRQHSDSRHRTCCTSLSLCRLFRRRLRGFVWDVRKMASRYEGTLAAMLWRSL
ncbi:hypothetical protein B0H12DRAFT_491356 [Mycena haematopus]|nr:hypothetical protein B0H12DRAFT_491356 [Mycena haematopus]